ncbi:MAG: response regulator transcription factor [Actinomycetota bacterium]
MIAVLLVDDQPLVRAGLQQILGLEDDINVVGEAGDGQEAIDVLANLRVDAVLMDIRMRGMDGVEATRRIRDADGPPVLALTTFDDNETLWGAIDAGVVGFLLKEAPAEDIIRAVRTVAGGGGWLDPAVTARVLSAGRSGSPAQRSDPVIADRSTSPAGSDNRASRLSPRETEVLLLMTEGFSNPEIADRLHVGSATVKSHVGAVFSKLEVRDRAGAIIYAFQNDLAG